MQIHTKGDYEHDGAKYLGLGSCAKGDGVSGDLNRDGSGREGLPACSMMKDEEFVLEANQRADGVVHNGV